MHFGTTLSVGARGRLSSIAFARSVFRNARLRHKETDDGCRQVVCKRGSEESTEAELCQVGSTIGCHRAYGADLDADRAEIREPAERIRGDDERMR